MNWDTSEVFDILQNNEGLYLICEDAVDRSDRDIDELIDRLESIGDELVREYDHTDKIVFCNVRWDKIADLLILDRCLMCWDGEEVDNDDSGDNESSFDILPCPDCQPSEYKERFVVYTSEDEDGEVCLSMLDAMAYAHYTMDTMETERTGDVFIQHEIRVYDETYLVEETDYHMIDGKR